MVKNSIVVGGNQTQVSAKKIYSIAHTHTHRNTQNWIVSDPIQAILFDVTVYVGQDAHCIRQNFSIGQVILTRTAIDFDETIKIPIDSLKMKKTHTFSHIIHSPQQ